MKTIICLTDYKHRFGSKWNDNPYRSGLDKDYLAMLFRKSGYIAEFVPMSTVDFMDSHWENQMVLYTSSEEYGLHYKYFIEDIVFGLEQAGAKIIPAVSFLRANNNKVFMEILRQVKLPVYLQSLKAQCFGTYNELEQALADGKINFPCVLKKAAGAMSRGVFLAKDEQELRRKAKKISMTKEIKVALKEKIRIQKHKGYKTESDYQGKFIIQPFISGLQNDWKILVYGEKYFILRRNIRKDDFRASGSGYNYASGSESGFPIEMLNFVRDFNSAIDVPNLSMDFGFDGKKGYIFEFQAVYFGTSTHYDSKDYYEFVQGEWKLMKNTLDQEQVYAQSIVDYLK